MENNERTVLEKRAKNCGVLYKALKEEGFQPDQAYDIVFKCVEQSRL